MYDIDTRLQIFEAGQKNGHKYLIKEAIPIFSSFSMTGSSGSSGQVSSPQHYSESELCVKTNKSITDLRSEKASDKMPFPNHCTVG